jgi:hypothetical protein
MSRCCASAAACAVRQRCREPGAAGGALHLPPGSVSRSRDHYSAWTAPQPARTAPCRASPAHGARGPPLRWHWRLTHPGVCNVSPMRLPCNRAARVPLAWGRPARCLESWRTPGRRCTADAGPCGALWRREAIRVGTAAPDFRLEEPDVVEPPLKCGALVTEYLAAHLAVALRAGRSGSGRGDRESSAPSCASNQTGAGSRSRTSP